jgi:hypothetical protein
MARRLIPDTIMFLRTRSGVIGFFKKDDEVEIHRTIIFLLNDFLESWHTWFNFYCVNLSSISFMSFLIQNSLVRSKDPSKATGKRGTNQVKIRLAMCLPVMPLFLIFDPSSRQCIYKRL